MTDGWRAHKAAEAISESDEKARSMQASDAVRIRRKQAETSRIAAAITSLLAEGE
ncbi:MAG TPA: hypothetical protein VE442_20060 [Jatrophihabitans sp.]|jgi:hypothetical protein|nr:hypothetical protein [Jatrophihabitans sp.]